MLKRLILAAAAVAALAASTLTASAANDAVVTTDLNLRSGPGTQFTVLATIPAGSYVDVFACTPTNWCDIAWGRARGWVAGTYLAAVGAPQPPVVVSPPVYVQPPIIGIYPPSPPYWYDRPGRPGKPHRPHRPHKPNKPNKPDKPHKPHKPDWKDDKPAKPKYRGKPPCPTNMNCKEW